MFFLPGDTLWRSYVNYTAAKSITENLKQLYHNAFNINGKNPQKNDWDKILKSLYKICDAEGMCHFFGTNENRSLFDSYSKNLLSFDVVDEQVLGFKDGTISYASLKKFLAPLDKKVLHIIKANEKELFELEGDFSEKFHDAYVKYCTSRAKKDGVFMAQVMQMPAVENFIYKFMTS